MNPRDFSTSCRDFSLSATRLWICDLCFDWHRCYLWVPSYQEKRTESVLSWSLVLHNSIVAELVYLCFFSLYVHGSVFTLCKLAWSISVHVLYLLLLFIKDQFLWVRQISVNLYLRCSRGAADLSDWLLETEVVRLGLF